MRDRPIGTSASRIFWEEIEHKLLAKGRKTFVSRSHRILMVIVKFRKNLFAEKYESAYGNYGAHK